MTIEQALKKIQKKYDQAQNNKWVIKPLAYALYQVWREADSEHVRDTWGEGNGEWEHYHDNRWRCTACGGCVFMPTVTCPNCGATMKPISLDAEIKL